METKLLESFVTVAEELHFGRAAQRLGVLPSVVGRNVRLLEEEIGARLLNRTTRSVTLTPAGEAMLSESRALLSWVAESIAHVRQVARAQSRILRIGTIDSAATGLLPQVLRDFRLIAPDAEIQITEDKTARLLPRLSSGALDIAFVRPPPLSHGNLRFVHLLDEVIVVALPESHALAERRALTIDDIVDVPMIVPSPRSRPHTYRLTYDLFAARGRKPKIAQQAEEKHTTVTLVGMNLGAALIPYWSSRIAVDGVVYRPLLDEQGEPVRRLPLALATATGSDDPLVQEIEGLVCEKLQDYAR